MGSCKTQRLNAPGYISLYDFGKLMFLFCSINNDTA